MRFSTQEEGRNAARLEVDAARELEVAAAAIAGRAGHGSEVAAIDGCLDPAEVNLTRKVLAIRAEDEFSSLRNVESTPDTGVEFIGARVAQAVVAHRAWRIVRATVVACGLAGKG